MSRKSHENHDDENDDYNDEEWPRGECGQLDHSKVDQAEEKNLSGATSGGDGESFQL